MHVAAASAAANSAVDDVQQVLMIFAEYAPFSTLVALINALMRPYEVTSLC